MGILRTNKISGLETPTPVTGSVSFTGVAGTHLSISTSTDFSFQNADFTIEFWMNTPNNARSVGSFSQSPFAINGEECRIYLRSDNGLIGFKYRSTNKETSFISPTNQWTHIALVRQNSVIKLFKDGVPDNTNTLTDSSGNTNGVLTIGAGINTSGDGAFLGFISNLRILKGTALYTSDFTPPVHELQPIGDTVLLCCNSSTSATAEATGKTITVNGNAAASTFSPGLTRDFTYGTQFSGVAKFDTQGYFVPPSGTTEQRGRGRGVFGGGGENPSPGSSNIIDYIQIQTTGNAIDFGDLTQSRGFTSSCSSSNRGVFGGGGFPSSLNVIDYITIASTSNAIDFGDLSTSRRALSSCSSSTRGIFGGGYLTNSIEYITIASIGNVIDFGDLTVQRFSLSSCSSNTRGVFGGGVSPSIVNVIDYITIVSTGNAQDFGDLTSGPRYLLTSCSSTTRGIFAGGYVPGDVNIIDYITIASTGNSLDFGDLTLSRRISSACSSNIRGVIGGGFQSTDRNTIDYVTIASTGNAQDFGDLIQARYGLASCSDSHGGLS